MMKKSCNPFRDVGVEHDSGDDALCLSRAHDLDPVLESFRESTGVATVVALEGFARWAFFAARQSAELLLKALLPGYEQDKRLRGCRHDLKMLLAELAAPW
ncbi:HEPN domain-containing protein [Nocardia sp. NPDC058499]|uniref:HEPN domain-containing protein n=1 Tax=Nocardia sp. NPDC058499 TaxID=3346530 RepID=UPI00365DF190